MRKPAITARLLWGAMALCICSCQTNSDAEQEPASSATTDTAAATIDFSIVPGERVGRITAQSTESDIKKLYGYDKVVIRSVYIGEGESQPGIAVFPDSPNELEIVWDIAAATGNPEFIRISNDKSEWYTVQGVEVGTSLEELEKINGKPFQLYGFGWDYGGLVTDWNNGKLNAHLIVALAPEDWEQVGPEVSGDRPFRSDDPAIRKLGLRVASLVVTFKEGKK